MIDFIFVAGCFIKDNGKQAFGKLHKMLYFFSLVFRSFSKNFYCEDKILVKELVKYLRIASGYRNILDYYEISNDLKKGNFSSMALISRLRKR